MVSGIENFFQISERPKKKVDAFEHYVNPLHVYCKLVNLGIEKITARKISIFYENTLHKTLIRRHRNEILCSIYDCFPSPMKILYNSFSETIK